MTHNIEWIEEFLDGGHEVLAIVALTPSGDLHIGMQRVLRNLPDPLYHTVLDTLVRGLDRMRESPMDDLKILGEWGHKG